MRRRSFEFVSYMDTKRERETCPTCGVARKKWERGYWDHQPLNVGWVSQFYHRGHVPDIVLARQRKRVAELV